MKTIKEKNQLVKDYYKKANNHVFTNVNGNNNKFFNIGIKENSETGENFIFSIEINDMDNITITIMKLWESYKQEHKVRWFPVYEKKVATKKFKELRVMLENIDNYIKEVIESAEMKGSRVRHNFLYKDKFNIIN